MKKDISKKEKIEHANKLICELNEISQQIRLQQVLKKQMSFKRFVLFR